MRPRSQLSAFSFPLSPRRGFTLVELLIVVTIIGMLAGISLAALAQARSVARVQRTKATIAKINDIVMNKYASYQTRRVPISTSGMQPQTAASIRLAALRQLMRLEMPERETDIVNDSTAGLGDAGASDPDFLSATAQTKVPVPLTDGTVPLKMPRPSVSMSFLRQYKKNPPSAPYFSAECLYAIVMMEDPDARGQFMDSEIGDVDGDHWQEFLDGWGNPIRFLRWAPGFDDSDVQANVVDPSLLSTSNTNYTMWTDAAVLAERQEAAQSDHDPFDSRKIDMSADSTDPNDPPRGWRLLPLIYSAGPDGIYDIRFNLTASSTDPPYSYKGNPYADAIGIPDDIATNNSVTAPGGSNGSLDHYDNIHNHRIEAD